MRGVIASLLPWRTVRRQDGWVFQEHRVTGQRRLRYDGPQDWAPCVHRNWLCHGLAPSQASVSLGRGRYIYGPVP